MSGASLSTSKQGCPAPGTWFSGISDGSTVDPTTQQTIPAGQPFNIFLPDPAGGAACNGGNGTNGNSATSSPSDPIVSDVFSYRQPYGSELTNTEYDPATGIYRALWTVASPYITETITYKSGKKIVRTLTTGIGSNLLVSGPSTSGPWATLGSAQLPKSACFLSSIVSSNNKIYAGSNAGVFESDDLGQSFTFLGGPTNILQLVAWENTLFAVTSDGVNSNLGGSGASRYQQYAPTVIYYTTNPRIGWIPLYTKSANQNGAHVTTPLVIPFASGPVILDDVMQNVVAAGSNAPVCVPTTGFDLLSVFPSATTTLTSSVQPTYLGSVNGIYYISIKTRDTVTADTVYLIYSVLPSGVTSYIGYADATSYTGGAYARPVFTYTAGVQALLQNIALSANTAVVTPMGNTLVVPMMLTPGGGLSSTNGAPA